MLPRNVLNCQGKITSGKTVLLSLCSGLHQCSVDCCLYRLTVYRRFSNHRDHVCNENHVIDWENAKVDKAGRFRRDAIWIRKTDNMEPSKRFLLPHHEHFCRMCTNVGKHCSSQWYDLGKPSAEKLTVLINWDKVLRPTRRKIGHFRDVLPSQSIGLVPKNWI